jgi:NADH:ubiquinone oxidoreductase subunit 3 (subunit A)
LACRYDHPAPGAANFGLSRRFGCAARAGEDRVPFDALLENYLAVFLASIVGIILVATALIATRVLAPYSKERGKSISYECGMLPIGRTRTQINVRYYLFAILFLIFDVDAVFLFPWAVNVADSTPMVFWEMVIFIGILAAGLGYAWKKGVLQWSKQ